MPFFALPPELSCLDRLRNCTFASVGDVVIALTAFWSVAIISKSRQWFLQPRWWQIGIFVSVEIVITVIFEALATGVLDRWKYANFMPTLPFFDTGLLTVLQWSLIPPVMIWFVKRQLSPLRQQRSKQT